MKPAIPLFRSALAAVALSVLLGPAASHAQTVDPKRINNPTPDLSLLPPAELEIYHYQVYDTQSGRRTASSDGKIGPGETLTILVAVRNNGGLRGSFDYALGTEALNKVFWRETGTDLGGGQKDVARFDVGFEALASTLPRAPVGYNRVCLGLWLMKRNLSIGWTDANNPNHQQRVCFEMYGVGPS